MPGPVHSGVTPTEGSATSSICILWALLSRSGTPGDLGSSGAGPWWSLRGQDTPGTEHCSLLPECCRRSHSHAPASHSPCLGLPLCSIQTFLKSSQFLRLNSRATSSRKPCMEKTSALRMSWALPIAVPTGSAVLITVSVRSGGHCVLCSYKGDEGPAALGRGLGLVGPCEQLQRPSGRCLALSWGPICPGRGTGWVLPLQGEPSLASIRVGLSLCNLCFLASGFRCQALGTGNAWCGYTLWVMHPSWMCGVCGNSTS